jgi:predicted transcriptional regulator
MKSQKKTSIAQERTLTEVELELMNILWRIQEGSVHHVIEHLDQDRPLAYTSVSTILRILEQKKVVGSRKEGRVHIYFPILTKSEYESTSVKKLIKNVFDGAPTAMVKQLLDCADLTQEDLKEITTLLQQKRSDQK